MAPISPTSGHDPNVLPRARGSTAAASPRLLEDDEFESLARNVGIPAHVAVRSTAPPVPSRPTLVRPHALAPGELTVVDRSR
jgi:hypothetical protein